MTTKISALPVVTVLSSTDVFPVVSGGVTSQMSYGNLVTELVEGLSWKDNARVRSGVNVNLAAPGANVDGVAMSAGDRFLAPLQTTPSEGGIYVWNGAAVPATRALDANTASELLNATLSIDVGTYGGTTWRQTATGITIGVTAIVFTIFGSGDLVGPGSATDKAVTRFSGTTGKLVQNSIVLITDTGEVQAGLGAVGTPSHSFVGRTNDGIYSVGANDVGIATNGVLRVDVSTTALTSTLPVVGPVGAVGSPTFTFTGDTTTGAYRVGASDWGVATGGTLRFDISTTAITSTLPINGPAGSAAAPSFSPLANAGLYGTGVANTIALSTNSAARLTVDTAAITSTLPVVLPAGAVATTSLNFGTAGTGIYGSATQVIVAISGSANTAFGSTGQVMTSGQRIEALANGVVILGGQQTTSANGPFAFQNQQVFTGSNVYQTGVRIIAGVNQTSTAEFAALKFELGNVIAGTGTPAYGSGGGFIIDALSNSASVFQVTAAGAVRANDGSVSLVGLSYVAEVNTGWNRTGAGTIMYVSAGTNYWSFSSALISQANGQQIRCAAANGQITLSGNATTGALANIGFTNGNSYTGSSLAQVGTSWTYTINQTSTAAWTALDINITETALGSGAQYLINAKAGIGGATQVFAVTNAGRVSVGDGTALLPSVTFVSDNTLGWYKDTANSVTFVTGGVSRMTTNTAGITLASGSTTITAAGANPLSLTNSGVTTGVGPSVRFTNVNSYTGSSLAQVGVALTHTINQTSTAAFTSLDIVRTETGVGSGTQYFINAKAGAAGTTQMFAVSNIGQVFATNSASATPCFSTIGNPTTGLQIAASNSISFSFAGSQWHTFSVNGTTASITAPNATTDFYVYNSQSQTTARLVLLSAAGGTNSYTASQVSVSCNTQWTGSSVEQRQFGIYPGVNQTSTATFTALDINATVAALGAGSTAPVFGSGGGYAIKVSTGGTSPTLFAAIKFDGTILTADGASTTPTHTFISQTTLGFYRGGADNITVSYSSGGQQRFTPTGLGFTSGGIFTITAGNLLTATGSIAATATPSFRETNATSFTGGAGILQIGSQIVYTINQTSTAAFTSLDFVITETAVGSGAQFLINAKAGISGATQVFAVTNGGAVRSDGVVGAPAFSFLSDTGKGFYHSASNSIGVAFGGALAYSFRNTQIVNETSGSVALSSINTGAVWAIAGRISTAVTPLLTVTNNTFFTGSATQQVAMSIAMGVNQTSTAGWTGLKIDPSSDGADGGAPVFGSGGSWFFDCRTNNARQFSVTTQGGMASVSVSPSTLASGTTNDYAGILGYGFARITANAANSTISGFSATNVPDGFQVTIINVSASATLSITNADAGSAAANRVLTTGGGTVVLAAKAVFYMIYDLTSATWRQV